MITFSLQLLSMLIILRQTVSTVRAGDQSSVSIERHMCPFVYMCGWQGMLEPMNVTYKNIHYYTYIHISIKHTLLHVHTYINKTYITTRTYIYQ